jgi:hypothetical protein
MPVEQPLADRFWAKVVRGAPDACWLYQGARLSHNAYGGFAMRSAHDGKWRPHYAHRVAWELTNGPIPDGQWVLHHCDVPHCVNPAHLFLGTQTENMRDASVKGRLSVPKRRNRARIAEIRTRWLAGGVTQRALAAEYGVHEVQVSRWLQAVKDRPYQRSA